MLGLWQLFGLRLHTSALLTTLGRLVWPVLWSGVAYKGHAVMIHRAFYTKSHQYSTTTPSCWVFARWKTSLLVKFGVKCPGVSSLPIPDWYRPHYPIQTGIKYNTMITAILSKMNGVNNSSLCCIPPFFLYHKSHPFYQMLFLKSYISPPLPSSN